MARKFKFPSWLRSKQLPILFSFVLIVVGALQSLHEQLAHDALSTDTRCELCLLSQSAEGGIIPLAISLPSGLFDQAPEVFLLLVLPFKRSYT